MTGQTPRFSISTRSSNDFEANPAKPKRQDVGAKQHHCAHLRLAEGTPNAAGMTAHEVDLKLLKFIGRNVNVRELPETGGNTVDDLTALDDLLNYTARREDRGMRLRRNLDSLALPVRRERFRPVTRVVRGAEALERILREVLENSTRVERCFRSPAFTPDPGWRPAKTEKGQADRSTWPFRLKLSGRRRTAGARLFGHSGRRWRGRHRLFFLCASTQAQHTGRHGHDHDHFD